MAAYQSMSRPAAGARGSSPTAAFAAIRPCQKPSVTPKTAMAERTVSAAFSSSERMAVAPRPRAKACMAQRSAAA